MLDDLLDDPPGITIGILGVGEIDCESAVRLLSKRDIATRKNRANDGAYNMAAQLLAAELNLAAGAVTCPDVATAVEEGQALLTKIEFDGSDSFLKGKKNRADRATANELASILDAYNNGGVCST